MRSSDPIDFASLAAALLDRAEQLLSTWLPDGRLEGHEWKARNPTRDDRSIGSFSVNVRTGAWADFADMDAKGGDLISLYAYLHNLNNREAARELMRSLGWSRGSEARRQQDQASGPKAEHSCGEKDGGRRKSMWRPVVPVPSYAPKPDGNHFHRGLPEAMWEYRIDDQLYGYVCRYRTSDGGKDVLPLTWCVDESDDRGTQRWHFKQWDEPRPLYFPAGYLSDDNTRPVVVVEGEKCALAGHEQLAHLYDFVSWPGGCKAWQLANWTLLEGRTVYLWPDCDAQRERLSAAERDAGVERESKPLLPVHKQPGFRAMHGIGTRLRELGCTVLMCQLPAPGDVTDGWDIADAIAQGWTHDQLCGFINRALPLQPLPEDDQPQQRAKRASTPSKAAAEEDGEPKYWGRYLLRTTQGAIKPVRENVVLALDGWPEEGVRGIPECEGLIRFNEFTNNVEKARPTPWGTKAGPWEEADELLMGQWLVRACALPSMPRSTLEEAVLVVAHRHAYHPVRERMLSLRGKWDGQPRLERWLRTVCLEEDEYDERDPLQQYLARVGKWFVMAMVARVLPTQTEGARIVRGPGTKFDYMLILEGVQGIGKSTVAATLGGDWFADTGLVLGEKDSYQNIQGVWVYEWAELDSMNKQEVSKVKAFISSWKDRFRASFDRRPRDYPRQVVFVGTVNEAVYLTDITGNRRMWPVRCTRAPDLEWLRANLEQMFAEAVHRLDAGERFWPSPQEQRELFDPQQRARTVVSSIEAEIRRYLYDEDQRVPPGAENGALLQQIGMTELLSRIGYTIDKQTDVVVKRAAAVMNALGWQLKRTSLPGRPYVYVRPAEVPQRQLAPVPACGSQVINGHTQATAEEAPDDCPF